jgi:hypothetical protein
MLMERMGGVPYISLIFFPISAVKSYRVVVPGCGWWMALERV